MVHSAQRKEEDGERTETGAGKMLRIFKENVSEEPATGKDEAFNTYYSQ